MNKQYILICILLIIVFSIGLSFVSHSYYESGSSSEIFSGTIVGTFKNADLHIENVYVDNSLINTSNDMPLTYTVDGNSSYCYIDDESIHDGNVVISGNDGLTISGYSSQEKCSIYLKTPDYWYDISQLHTYGDSIENTHKTCSETGHSVCIRSLNDYNPCANINGKTICMESSFTEYFSGSIVVTSGLRSFGQKGNGGLGLIIDSTYSKIRSEFSKKNISVACSYGTTTKSSKEYITDIYCYYSNYICGILPSGQIYCKDTNENVKCYITSSGTAKCQ